MSSKLNYTAESILNIKFSPKEKGYDSLEVDEIFDGIIADYKTFNKNIDELSKLIDKQKAEIVSLKEQQGKLEFEVAKLKEQLKAIPIKNGITDDNYTLLKKVAAYERVLHKKGVDLKKALSDPDNC